MKPSKGFVYVTTGIGYTEEAIKSAESLRRWHPDEKICLITDVDLKETYVFDDLIQIKNHEVTYSPIDKIHAALCPYDNVIFLDSDTFIVNRIDELFDILIKFDMALLPETRRGWNYRLPGVPRPFAEFNTGVIVFKNNELIWDLFKKWRHEYNKLRKEQSLTNDQPSFRSVLFHSNIRVAPIPSEYHFLGNTENYIMWKALLIHGRGDLEKIAALVNKKLGSRVYIPNIGSLTGFKGKLYWAKQLISFNKNSIPWVWTKPVDSSSLNPKKWWLEKP